MPTNANAQSRAADEALTFRRATVADWDDIARLLLACGLIIDGAREHIGEFLLAERDGVLAGCAAIEHYGDAGLLRSVAVAEHERGRGLGISLVERSLDAARAAGLKTMVLVTRTAVEFYPRFGFRIVARDEVPSAVTPSAEFQGACPSSSPVMMLQL
jgi:amino-acid N-acetyltransferase